MLEVIILKVGKVNQSYWIKASDEYLKRLTSHMKVTVHSIKESLISDIPKKIKLETKAIESFIENHQSFKPILLDLTGKLVTSHQISDLIKQSQAYGTGKLLWIIGGSNGVALTLQQNQKIIKIAFGLITLPHQLCFVILLEQIYRGWQIINNQPYHK